MEIQKSHIRQIQIFASHTFTYCYTLPKYILMSTELFKQNMLQCHYLFILKKEVDYTNTCLTQSERKNHPCK